MKIRKWAGSEKEASSKVDLTIDLILNSYLEIINMFADKEYSYSTKELEEFLLENMGEHYITKWFVAEGREFLEKLASTYVEHDESLYEELDYCLFILKSEEMNIHDWPEDVLGSMIDISDQISKLVFN